MKKVVLLGAGVILAAVSLRLVPSPALPAAATLVEARSAACITPTPVSVRAEAANAPPAPRPPGFAAGQGAPQLRGEGPAAPLTEDLRAKVQTELTQADAQARRLVGSGRPLEDATDPIRAARARARRLMPRMPSRPMILMLRQFDELEWRVRIAVERRSRGG